MSDLSQCKVLAVDDADANIDILMDAIGDDYDVSVAMDGENALEVAESEPPDLILLDIMMPDMDGYEVCSKLKENPKTKDIPVIFLTAMDEVQNKRKGYEMGAVDYITKPFEVLEIKARVKTHLSLIMAERELNKLKG